MKLLCIGLRLNKSVTALDLPDNDIGDAGVVELSLSVAHNSSLTQLQLAYNRISDEGAKALAAVGGEEGLVEQVRALALFGSHAYFLVIGPLA